MPRRGKTKRICDAEKAALEQEKLTERWRTEIFLSLIFLSALSRQYTKRASHPQKAEYSKPGQSHPKPPQGHHKATTRPYTRHRLRSTKPPQGHPKAPPRLHQGSTKAPPMRPQSHPQATPKLSGGLPAPWSLSCTSQTDAGCPGESWETRRTYTGATTLPLAVASYPARIPPWLALLTCFW